MQNSTSNGLFIVLTHMPTLNQIGIIHLKYLTVLNLKLMTCIILLRTANTNHATTEAMPLSHYIFVAIWLYVFNSYTMGMSGLPDIYT